MSYRVLFHPDVKHDLAAIVQIVTGYAGPRAAATRLSEIEAVVSGLADIPHKGSIRSDIARGLRAIPAGRKTVIAFSVDEKSKTVLVHAIGFAGSDWIASISSRGQ